MLFEWDSKQVAANERKHGVTFQEATTIFSDPMALTFADPDHSSDEDRDITFGFSRLERLLVVSTTARGERTRIISARLATRHGEKDL